jgi:cysteinyl-tRNA synthetase
MSKSLGNLVWVRDLLKTFMPDAIRLYLGKHHYREEWSYSEEELKVAEEEVKLIQDALNMEGGGENSLSVDSQREKFRTAMENDLDTPTAVNAIVNLAMEILSSTDQELNIEEAQGFLWEMGRIFGLRLGTKLNKLVEKRWRKHAGRFGG